MRHERTDGGFGTALQHHEQGVVRVGHTVAGAQVTLDLAQQLSGHFGICQRTVCHTPAWQAVHVAVSAALLVRAVMSFVSLMSCAPWQSLQEGATVSPILYKACP